jgi:hypothetical protein
MLHRLIRIATLTTVAACVTVLLGQTVQALPNRWFGHATCTVTTTYTGTISGNTVDYKDTQIHDWHLLPLPFVRDPKTQYSLVWSVSGDGHNTATDSKGTQVSKLTWRNDGASIGYLQFIVMLSDNMLHITEGPQMRDNSGVHDSNNMTGNIFELQFATSTMPIIAAPTTTHVSDLVSPTINGPVSYQEPAGSMHDISNCSYDFQLGPVELQRLPPGSLVKPPRR